MAESVLILAPPVASPSEPPAGALFFASFLQGQGIESYFWDLSIEFFNEQLKLLGTSARHLWHYFQTQPRYPASRYRGAMLRLQKEFQSGFREFPEWHITFTNCSYRPISVHQPGTFWNFLAAGGLTPFTAFYLQRVIPRIRELKPDGVGISFTFLSQLYAGLELAYYLQQEKIDVSAGGALIDAYRRTGQPLPAIFRELFGLTENDPRARLGHHYWPEDALYRHWAVPNLLNPVESYLTPIPVVPLLTAKGCYYHGCRFCPDRDTPYYPLDLDFLPEWMREWEKKNCQSVPAILWHIIDAAIPPRHLRQLIRIRPSHYYYYGFVRFEPVFENDELMAELSTNGCGMLQWGLESASTAILDAYHKNQNPERIAAILKAASLAGIRNYLYVLMGLPGETENDRQLTLEFLQSHSSFFEYLNLSLFNLPILGNPESDETRWIVEFSQEPHYQGDFNFYRSWSENGMKIRHQARQFILKKMQTDRIIRSKLLQTPVVLRSDHAYFMEGGRWDHLS